MAPFLVAFLGAFGLVIGLGATFVTLYRHHVRQLRRLHRSYDHLAAWAMRRAALPTAPPQRWLAFKSSNTLFVREILGLRGEAGCPWSEALTRCRERTFFVSPPVDSWTLVIGSAIPDPATDVDASYHFLTRLSREVGEVQFFSADRVLNFHSWIRIREGRVARAYAWADGTLWNEGRVSLDERLLGLRSRAYTEEAEPLAYGETSPDQINCERVVLLARRWSLDPIAASELILQQEHLESGTNRPE